jgi:hypothetical protein
MISFKDGYERTNIVGVTISGSISSDDIVKLEDAMDQKLDRFDTIRVLTQMIDHEGWTFTGLLKDLMSKFKYASKVDKSAIIADSSWDDAAQLADQLTSGEMRRFSIRQEDAARDWIKTGCLTD